MKSDYLADDKLIETLKQDIQELSQSITSCKENQNSSHSESTSYTKKKEDLYKESQGMLDALKNNQNSFKVSHLRENIDQMND